MKNKKCPLHHLFRNCRLKIVEGEKIYIVSRENPTVAVAAAQSFVIVIVFVSRSCSRFFFPLYRSLSLVGS